MSFRRLLLPDSKGRHRFIAITHPLTPTRLQHRKVGTASTDWEHDFPLFKFAVSFQQTQMKSFPHHVFEIRGCRSGWGSDFYCGVIAASPGVWKGSQSASSARNLGKTSEIREV